MADMNAEIKLVLDDGSIESKLSQLVAGFDRLNATGKQTAVGLTAVEAAGVEAGAGAEAAAKGATEASGAFERLAADLTRVRGAAAVAGEGLEMLGAEAGGAAGKVGMASEALETLGKTAGPLIAVGLAIAAIGAAFAFVGEGVREAEKAQSYMTSLGAAVEAQGQSWEQNREKVEEWLKTERMATGFLNSELLPALNQLVTAGHNVHDAEIIASVSAEVSRAKHMDLLDVTNRIIQAESGRPQGLAKIDLGMKALITNHASLSQEMQYLHKHYGNQLNDLNDATLAHARLKGEVEALSEAIGNKLLPFIASMSYAFLGAIKIAGDLGSAIGGVFNDVAGAIGNAAMASVHFANGLDALKRLDLKGAAGEFGQVGSRISEMNKHLSNTKNFAKLGSAMSADFEKAGRHLAGDAVKKHQDSLKDIHVQQLVAPKDTGSTSAGGGTVTGTFYGPYKEQIDAVKQAQDALDQVLETNNHSLERFKINVADSTTEMGRLKAQDAEAAQQMKVLEANSISLNTVVDQQSIKAGQLSAERTKEIATLNKASAAHDALQKAMLAAGGGSDAQKVKLQDLTTAHDAAQKALDRTNQLISENTANLAKNQKQLDANAQAIASLRKVLTDVMVDWDTFNQKMMRDDQQHADTLGMTHKQLAAYYNQQYKEDLANYKAALDAKDAATARYYEGLAKADLQHVHDQDRLMQDTSQQWTDFMKKQSLKYNEDLATWQMTNAQKVAFYKTALDQMGKITADNIEQAKQMQQQLLSAEIGAIQDQKKAYQQLMQEETNYVDRFFQDITDKSKGFSAFWKSLWADLKNYYIHQFADMIVHSSLFQTVMGQPGQGGVLGSILPQTHDQSAKDFRNATTDFKISTTDFKTSTTTFRADTSTHQQSTNTFQSSTGTFQQAVDQFMHAVSQIGSGGSGSGSGGGGLGSLFGFGSGGNGIFDPTSIGGASWADGSALGKDVNISSVGGKALSGNGAVPTNITHVGGASVSGALQGFGIGQMIAGIDGGNSTWGGVGGAIGGAFFGPAGAAVGGFIGSQFGNHTLGPKYQPDLYNPAWGQADVDWNGAYGAQTFGNQQFTAQSQYNVGQGGTPLYKQMENWANAHKNDTNLTQAQKDMLAKILGLEGGNANADFGVTSEKNNIAYLANGQQIPVPDLIALEQAYNSSVGSSAAQYTYKIDRNAPNFSTALVSPWNAPTYPGSNGATTTGGGTPRGITDPHITVNIDNTNGTIVGPGGIEALTHTITQQIQRNLRTGYGNQYVTI